MAKKEKEIIKENIESDSLDQIMILANKRDLMPKEAKDEDLREYVAHRFRASGLPAQKEDVLLLSLSSLSGTSEAAKLIEEKRRRHDVYIIGATGAGKTLFLSSFLHDFTNKSSRSIITGEYPSTHLRVMRMTSLSNVLMRFLCLVANAPSQGRSSWPTTKGNNSMGAVPRSP